MYRKRRWVDPCSRRWSQRATFGYSWFTGFTRKVSLYLLAMGGTAGGVTFPCPPPGWIDGQHLPQWVSRARLASAAAVPHLLIASVSQPSTVSKNNDSRSSSPLHNCFIAVSCIVPSSPCGVVGSTVLAAISQLFSISFFLFFSPVLNLLHHLIASDVWFMLNAYLM